jgi:hypothetical protein
MLVLYTRTTNPRCRYFIKKFVISKDKSYAYSNASMYITSICDNVIFTYHFVPI